MALYKQSIKTHPLTSVTCYYIFPKFIIYITYCSLQNPQLRSPKNSKSCATERLPVAFSVLKLWSSSLLYKIKMLKYTGTIILPVVLYECDTWPRTLTKKYRLRYPRTWCGGRQFALGGRKQLETGENYVLRA